MVKQDPKIENMSNRHQLGYSSKKLAKQNMQNRVKPFIKFEQFLIQKEMITKSPLHLLMVNAFKRVQKRMQHLKVIIDVFPCMHKS